MSNMDSTNLEKAQVKFNNADKLLQTGLLVFAGFIVVFFVVVVVQLYQVNTTIAKNQVTNAAASNARFKKYTEENEQEHAKTQKYVRCIADTLQKPIEDRTDAAFDACSKP